MTSVVLATPLCVHYLICIYFLAALNIMNETVMRAKKLLMQNQARLYEYINIFSEAEGEAVSVTLLYRTPRLS